ncbi:MAG: precorrin-3B C(17)-methyltransferase [Deltaproteobacteria bacterium]|nr:precorrin-3B C(17)-methyltransferase [Deltaproteobacteria bacterium]
MARVGRLAGAILADTDGAYYLVGNPKVPCDWEAAGFAPPGAIDALTTPFIHLHVVRPPDLAPPWLTLDVEGEGLARLLVHSFVIPRTGSISERLWRLATGQRDDDDAPVPTAIPGRWLAELPAPVWQIVRDAVLRCS